MLKPYIDKYEKYLAYAFTICRCNDLKNDLVNDMFLKLNKILEEEPSKEISDGYVYMILKSIYLNQVRDNKEFVLDGYVFEAIDNDESLEQRLKINEALGQLPFVEREILLKTQEHTLRHLATEMGCSHEYIRLKRIDALENLKKVYG